ncbi:hypothetical protein [Sphingomonas sp. 8AM]|uniref:hypothetical protein n=1 Tax=Sphingomonas sp. 8AM TaxID=2653170 RepID=UPI0013589090|nr:hypothetical protein [Sphingomonas sp. 8AM]
MILLMLLAQTTPVAPIVKGTALPPSGTEEAQVMVPVDALLRAIETNDRAAALAATLPEGTITATRTAPDGAPQRRTLRWAEWAAQLTPEQGLVEKQGVPAIEIDDNAAMVWAPYTVTVSGKPVQCGYNLFDVVRGATGWKILNVTYSARTEGCTS